MNNVDANELAKFNRVATSWWDTAGEFRTLHAINPVRLKYIQQCCGNLSNKNMVDVGCGAGILTEALAQHGAKVTGIDMATEVLDQAQQHASLNNLNIDYQQITAEALAAKQPEQYDIVTCLEMLEHVPDPVAIIQACARLCRPEGHIIFSTINRSWQAFAGAIVGAEYLLRLLPRGTHEYGKFITPAELGQWALQAGLQLLNLTGLHYNPLTHTVSLQPSVAINYLAHCRPFH